MSSPRILNIHNIKSTIGYEQSGAYDIKGQIHHKFESDPAGDSGILHELIELFNAPEKTIDFPERWVWRSSKEMNYTKDLQGFERKFLKQIKLNFRENADYPLTVLITGFKNWTTP
jgi:hypothetical protein